MGGLTVDRWSCKRQANSQNTQVALTSVVEPRVSQRGSLFPWLSTLPVNAIPSSFYSPGLGTPSWGIYIYLHISYILNKHVRRNFFWKLRDFVEFYFILVIASGVPPCFLNFNFFGRNSWWHNTAGPIAGKACTGQRWPEKGPACLGLQQERPQLQQEDSVEDGGAKRRTGEGREEVTEGPTEGYWLLQDGTNREIQEMWTGQEETGKTQRTDNQEQS